MTKPLAKLLKQSTHAYVHTHDTVSSQKVSGKRPTADISITSVGASATYATPSAFRPASSSCSASPTSASSSSCSSRPRAAHAARHAGTQSSAASSGASARGRTPRFARRRASAALST